MISVADPQVHVPVGVKNADEPPSTETDCGLIHCAWQVDKSIYSKVTTMVQLVLLVTGYGHSIP
ncbi:MAG: hypothetical protein RIT30_1103, partial [Bacteroidota bacterium]